MNTYSCRKGVIVHSIDVYFWEHVHTATLRGYSVGMATSHGILLAVSN